jgi:integrase
MRNRWPILRATVGRRIRRECLAVSPPNALKSSTRRASEAEPQHVLGAPKSETSRRRVDFTPDVAQLLADQWARLGKPGDDTLVFPGRSRVGYLNAKTVRRTLYGAMARAGIPRAGETGTLRTFHSFRHTYAKRALESGRAMFWLSRHLGHSSMVVTEHVYGHWSREEAKRDAAAMEGVFGV